MRILMISDVYFPRINGVSTSIMGYRRALREAGHEVTLICPAYDGEPEQETDILRVPARKVPLDEEDRFMRATYILRMEAALRERAFDLIHIQTPFVAHRVGVKLARRLGLPLVETYHTFFEEYLYHYVPFLPRAWLRGMARRYSRRQCNEVDAVVVPSTAMHQVLRDYGVDASLEIIPTGIALRDFSAGDGAVFRRQHGIAPDRPVLIHIGRIAFEKNIDFLLRMLVRVKQALPEVLLVVAGEGPALADLKRQAAELDLQGHILFVGYLSRGDALLDCYRAGDVFVFASRTETQGLVLLEAMALELPVVSTAMMGTRDILVQGQGALIAEEDEADFAAKVISLLRDPLQGGRLARAGRQYVERHWSEQAFVRRTVELYRAVAGGEFEKLDVAAEGGG